jgi:hypothetical protein
MKALKNVMVVLLAVACIMPVLFANEAQAAPTWVTAWVNRAGAGAGTPKLIQLTDSTGTMPAVNHTWFTISNYDANSQSQMLIIALTAMTSGLKIVVYVNDTVPYSTVTQMYLLDK